MQTKYYTYGNVTRILTLDDADFSKSKMVDVSTENETILGTFDASRPFDTAFIRSYLNILIQSTVGFHPTSSPSILFKIYKILKNNNILS